MDAHELERSLYRSAFWFSAVASGLSLAFLTLHWALGWFSERGAWILGTGVVFFAVVAWGYRRDAGERFSASKTGGRDAAEGDSGPAKPPPDPPVA